MPFLPGPRVLASRSLFSTSPRFIPRRARRDEPPPTAQQVKEQPGPEERRDEEPGENSHPGPEGDRDEEAVEHPGRGRRPPPTAPSEGQQERGGQHAGEQPTEVVREWHAVVDAALRPYPEAQGGRARV